MMPMMFKHTEIGEILSKEYPDKIIVVSNYYGNTDFFYFYTIKELLDEFHKNLNDIHLDEHSHYFSKGYSWDCRIYNLTKFLL
jgi:hypothetical protein